MRHHVLEFSKSKKIVVDIEAKINGILKNSKLLYASHDEHVRTKMMVVTLAVQPDPVKKVEAVPVNKGPDPVDKDVKTDATVQGKEETKVDGETTTEVKTEPKPTAPVKAEKKIVRTKCKVFRAPNPRKLEEQFNKFNCRRVRLETTKISSDSRNMWSLLFYEE